MTAEETELEDLTTHQAYAHDSTTRFGRRDPACAVCDHIYDHASVTRERDDCAYCQRAQSERRRRLDAEQLTRDHDAMRHWKVLVDGCPICELKRERVGAVPVFRAKTDQAIVLAYHSGGKMPAVRNQVPTYKQGQNSEAIDNSRTLPRDAMPAAMSKCQRLGLTPPAAFFGGYFAVAESFGQSSQHTGLRWYSWTDGNSADAHHYGRPIQEVIADYERVLAAAEVSFE